jgi:hypothetical protein
LRACDAAIRLAIVKRAGHGAAIAMSARGTTEIGMIDGATECRSLSFRRGRSRVGWKRLASTR